jgi:hypothetical protein
MGFVDFVSFCERVEARRFRVARRWFSVVRVISWSSAWRKETECGRAGEARGDLAAAGLLDRVCPGLLGLLGRKADQGPELGFVAGLALFAIC